MIASQFSRILRFVSSERQKGGHMTVGSLVVGTGAGKASVGGWRSTDDEVMITPVHSQVKRVSQVSPIDRVGHRNI